MDGLSRVGQGQGQGTTWIAQYVTTVPQPGRPSADLDTASPVPKTLPSMYKA